jgi:hypothetical protein
MLTRDGRYNAAFSGVLACPGADRLHHLQLEGLFADARDREGFGPGDLLPQRVLLRRSQTQDQHVLAALGRVLDVGVGHAVLRLRLRGVPNAGDAQGFFDNAIGNFCCLRSVGREGEQDDRCEVSFHGKVPSPAGE